jgi:hypothetical protein
LAHSCVMVEFTRTKFRSWRNAGPACSRRASESEGIVLAVRLLIPVAQPFLAVRSRYSRRSS